MTDPLAGFLTFYFAFSKLAQLELRELTRQAVPIIPESPKIPGLLELRPLNSGRTSKFWDFRVIIQHKIAIRQWKITYSY